MYHSHILTVPTDKEPPAQGHVDLVGAGPGDPELLTVKALNALNSADVVIYDRLISDEILSLIRGSAKMIDVGKKGFAHSVPQEDINALIIHHAQSGAYVVRLKSGDPTVFGRLDEEIETCQAANISWRIIPGITSASAAVAGIGQSLTKRARNSSVRFIAGHDIKGFAEHDWRALARNGEVAAIYMGKKSSRFIQGRLLMHGADPETPVTIIENVSRPDEQVLTAQLFDFAEVITKADMQGPALVLLGLAPRKSQSIAAFIQHNEIAL